MKLTSGLCNPDIGLLFQIQGVEKKDKMIFSYLVWGGTRRYGGIGRKSPFTIPLNLMFFFCFVLKHSF